MPALSTIAIVAGLAATAGATIYSANKQEAAANKQLDQAEQQRKVAEEQVRQSNSSEAQTAAKAKQDQSRKQALAAYGTSDTLLTGPNGLGSAPTPGTQQPASSTLLGA